MFNFTDESEFLTAFRKGKEKAFRWLYEEYYASLCTYCFRLTGDEQAAGDFAQDAFIRLWENRENFTSYAAIRSYLYTLGKNAALNYLKHLKIRAGYREEKNQEQHEDSAIELLIQQEAERQLSHLIRALSPECRQVIYLLAEGKSYKEVGEVLHISPNTVKNHRVKAVKIMKNMCRHIFFFFFFF